MAGTYQSRAFNFINGQTNRVKNSLGQGWRQIKVSVQWTGQILLAPLRWLNRFSQNTKRQIPSKDNSRLLLEETSLPTKNKSTAITHNASRAIEALLAEVAAAGYGLIASTSSAPVFVHDDWSVIDENEWDTAFLDESNRNLAGNTQHILTPQPDRPIIQGLATLLANQHLVLIDQHNQVLDILSPSQQLHIRQQIGPVIQQVLSSKISESATDHTLAEPSPATPVVLLAPISTTPRSTWQQVGYWCKYYLEYLQVDIGSTVDPDRSLTSPSRLHKSLAVIPASISSLSPEPATSLSTPPENTDRANKTNITLHSPITVRTNATIDIPTPTAQVTFKPEWIEAPTEALGYERTLWQQLWLWIDRIMLKIENWIISTYQQLTKTR
jgi:hypothetical protein